MDAGPSVHPWAAKLNWKSELSNITLANVLSGNTCTPISLEDFEKYLTYHEHSIETLQFLVWFQDYRERFPKLHREKHDLVFGTPCHAEIERRATESITKTEAMEFIRKYPVAATVTMADTGSRVPTSPTLPTSPRTADEDPLRIACSRVVATFLSPNATKELPVDAIVRDTVIRSLAYDCHPDVFVPVYEEVYNLLERHSLPAFLAVASSNATRAVQICGYCVGYSALIIGFTITVLLIMLLPTPPEANRCWRLLTVFLFSFGIMQCYFAWRGFCGVLWFRGVKQLTEWEMQEMSEDTRTFIGNIVGPRAVHPNKMHNKPDGSQKTETQRPSGNEVKQGSHTSLTAVSPGSTVKDMVTIAPFMKLEPNDTLPSHVIATRHTLRGPFGPVATVVDPRIKTVQRKVFVEMLMFGLFVLLISSAIILSIPGRRGRDG